MADEYTPTDEQVRSFYVGGRDEYDPDPVPEAQMYEDFDRWLAAHDARVRAEAEAWKAKALTHIGQSARKGHKLHDVRTMHRRFGIYEHEDACPDTSDEHREEHHHEDSDDYGESYCDEMLIEYVCSECRDENSERVEWPCPTVKILDKEN